MNILGYRKLKRFVRLAYELEGKTVKFRKGEKTVCSCISGHSIVLGFTKCMILLPSQSVFVIYYVAECEFCRTVMIHESIMTQKAGDSIDI
jgi:hypothetical protein